MDINDDRIREAVRHTEILRTPKQSLYTFGTTNISYYLVTEPAYSDLIRDITETVIREGKVIAQRPRIVTPYYLSRLDGFSSEARRYFEVLLQEYGADVRGVYYTYKNEPTGLNIVSDNLEAVVDRINADIDRRGDPLAAIIKGEDELWDVSIMKFIFEMTRSSLNDNLSQMWNRGLLKVDSSGIPADARMKIEELFGKVTRGESEPRDLRDELERWGVFDEYEDRFFAIFRQRRR